LRRLAQFIEKAEKLKSQIKGAMTYPIVVMAIAIIVISVILVFVIPVLKTCSRVSDRPFHPDSDRW